MHMWADMHTLLKSTNGVGLSQNWDSGVLGSGSDDAAKSVLTLWSTHLPHCDSISSTVKLRDWMISQVPSSSITFLEGSRSSLLINERNKFLPEMDSFSLSTSHYFSLTEVSS